MKLSLPRLLFGLAVCLAALDVVWGVLGQFHVDCAAFARLALLSLALFGGGLLYHRLRPDPALASMLMGASFLCAFSAAASVLNYYLISVAGPRIDDILVAADRMLGFDWYRVMLAMADHPLFNALLFRVYNFTLPQIALVMVALAWTGQPEKVYRFCLAIAVGALAAIGFWAAFPSFGAESLYTLPHGVESRLAISVNTQYGRELVALLHDGPGYITPSDLRGLIGFPSYHAVLALVIVWYARSVRFLRWPLLALNLLVLVSVPIQGGHHLVDVLGAIPVTLLAIAISESRKLAIAVNELETEKIASIPTGPFRVRTAQNRAFGPLSD